MKTAFITGATGFIGAHLTRALLDEGYHVKVLTRKTTIDNALWAATEVEVVQGDLLQPEQWQDALLGCTFVFHTAGEVRNESRMDALNVTGTQHLLQACAAANVTHIVHLSSVGVIGANRAGPIDETEPANPFNTYEVSKWEAEKVVAAWQQNNSIPVAVLRPTVVYGEQARSTLILFWMKLVQRGIRFTIGSNPVANYVYVADVVKACLAVSIKKANDTFIVGNPILLKDFIEIGATVLGRNARALALPKWVAMAVANIATPLFKLLGRKSPWTPELVQALALQSSYEAKKLEVETDWTATPHTVGLAKTIEWYLAEKLL